MKRLVKATAAFALMAIPMSVCLTSTDYWVAGIVGFLFGTGYLTMFVWANLPRWSERWAR